MNEYVYLKRSVKEMKKIKFIKIGVLMISLIGSVNLFSLSASASNSLGKLKNFSKTNVSKTNVWKKANKNMYINNLSYDAKRRENSITSKNKPSLKRTTTLKTLELKNNVNKNNVSKNKINKKKIMTRNNVVNVNYDISKRVGKENNDLNIKNLTNQDQKIEVKNNKKNSNDAFKKGKKKSINKNKNQNDKIDFIINEKMSKIDNAKNNDERMYISEQMIKAQIYEIKNTQYLNLNEIKMDDEDESEQQVKDFLSKGSYDIDRNDKHKDFENRGKLYSNLLEIQKNTEFSLQ